MRIASFSITHNQKNCRKKNKQLIMACPLGNSQSLESQFGLYSAIRNRVTMQSKPDLRYGITIYKVMNWVVTLYYSELDTLPYYHYVIRYEKRDHFAQYLDFAFAASR